MLSTGFHGLSEEEKNKKKESMKKMVLAYVWRSQIKSKRAWKKYRKNMSEEEKYESILKKEYMNRYSQESEKNQSNNMLKETKSNGMESDEVGELKKLTKFLKDKANSYNDDSEEEDFEENSEKFIIAF